MNDFQEFLAVVNSPDGKADMMEDVLAKLPRRKYDLANQADAADLTAAFLHMSAQ